MFLSSLLFRLFLRILIFLRLITAYFKLLWHKSFLFGFQILVSQRLSHLNLGCLLSKVRAHSLRKTLTHTSSTSQCWPFNAAILRLTTFWLSIVCRTCCGKVVCVWGSSGRALPLNRDVKVEGSWFEQLWFLKVEVIGLAETARVYRDKSTS